MFGLDTHPLVLDTRYTETNMVKCSNKMPWYLVQITFDGEKERDLVKLGLRRRSLGQVQDLEEAAL